MERRTICVAPGPFIPEFYMIVAVPIDQDATEYIDEFLSFILTEDLRQTADWDFVDGL